MSNRDLEQNRGALTAFKGRRCFAVFSTNSIRFRFDDREKKGCYLWIDPPWVFLRDCEVLAHSGSYSGGDDFEYKEWCHQFVALRDTVLEDFEETGHGAVTFCFSGGYRLLIPKGADSEKSEDLEYDQWYTYDKTTG